MFKPVYFNHEYTLTHDGRCRYKGAPLEITTENIDIDVEGVIHSFNYRKLCLYTHYKFNPFIVHIDNVDFHPVDSKVLRLRCGHVPVFREAVELPYGFRVIPGYSNHAVNRNGLVISIKYNGRSMVERINPYGYRCVNIWDEDKESWRMVGIHILLARAFIHNPNPSERYYVNHKDGNKLNISLSNLEWVSPAENNSHAQEMGLKDPACPRECTVHDLELGTSEDFGSVVKAIEAYGLNGIYYGKTKLIDNVPCPRIYRGRYVVTEIGEPHNVTTNDLGTYVSNSPHSGPFQFLEVETGAVKEVETINEMIDATKVPYHQIRAIIESPTPKKTRGYSFRAKSNQPWPESFEELIKLKRRAFEVTHSETGEVKVFSTMADILEFFNTHYQKIINLSKSGEIFKGWRVKDITEHQSA